MKNKRNKVVKPASRHRREKEIKTTESWYPTEDGKVKVTFQQLGGDEWRVCVWGGDDFGLERDFHKENRATAEELYGLLSDGVTQAEMRSLGMYNA